MPKAVRVYMNPKAVTNAARAALPRILKRQGAYTRTSMRNSIKRVANGKPASPGRQPYTHSKLLKNAMRFQVDTTRESVVIGPSFRIAGIIGHTHEFGGREMDNKIPSKKGFLGSLEPPVKSKNWNLVIGGYGPIREVGGARPFKFGHLHTLAQVNRAKALAKRLEAQYAGRARTKGRMYPKRPFAAKTLDRVARSGRLVEFWRDSIGPQGGSGIGQLV